jgi:hypothetical protein
MKYSVSIVKIKKSKEKIWPFIFKIYVQKYIPNAKNVIKNTRKNRKIITIALNAIFKNTKIINMK